MFSPYRMSSVFRRLMFSNLTRLGLTYSRQTPPQKIHDLFKCLWPQDCGHELRRRGEYLIPDLGTFDAVFSPGVGLNSDFELHFAELGVPCFMADASVDGPAVKHPLFNFQKKFLGPSSGGEFISLDDWISGSYPHVKNGLLQMDIEGGEYETLLAVDSDVLKRFKLIVLEVHQLNILASQEGFALGRVFIQKLLRDFHVCHLHVNNYLRPIRYRSLVFPSDIELTLIRKDLCGPTQPVSTLPHSLDTPSAAKKPDPRFYSHFEQGIIRLP